MAYEILVLDIDGTLTNSKKEISNKTLDSIMKIQERGHKVVLASGRPTPGVLPLANKLKLSEYNGYILSFNGAKIINCNTNEIIYQKVLPGDIIPRLHKAASENSVGIISYEDNCIITDSEIDEFMETEARINGIPIKKVNDFPSYINFNVNKCLMTGHSAKLEKVEVIMREKFGQQLSIYRSEPFFLELMPQNIDKAYSLGKLLDYLGLSKEQMISCGDGYNDLSMIQYAGMGVAMANAQDVVKKAADYITLSNDDDGIAHVINEFML
ncbi:Cof-type HAD-IIB family hydrolase [Anaerocolumna sedimenticola]|uniref:Cof-type HAD-IIB family hydrolase n=1 Tax=Anaerocolumna sedimenticola TaxID=2696063 RepID=A0A6P1TRY5_9FIRM|nr:Cof-type HAD-IIB family hydrolase [Anaerocolumna sedimenticola]QHQ62701.1 Cof-type HAD-IIB family hydrolase [Anaerocolumna sedimenticola]